MAGGGKEERVVRVKLKCIDAGWRRGGDGFGLLNVKNLKAELALALVVGRREGGI